MPAHGSYKQRTGDRGTPQSQHQLSVYCWGYVEKREIWEVLKQMNYATFITLKKMDNSCFYWLMTLTLMI